MMEGPMIVKKVQDLEPPDITLVAGLPAPVWRPAIVAESFVSVPYRIGTGEVFIVDYEIDEEIGILEEGASQTF
jgi:hypothetical protein